MKKIGFIGAYDKTDFILYIAKILVELGKRVLLIDATITQKARYIVPNIQNSKAYLTEFEGIDVAVGMKSYDEIKAFLRVPPNAELPYDVVLIDTNSAGGVLSFRINECTNIYFATSMDMYSIKKGVESLSVLKTQLEVTKILFSNKAKPDEIQYINYLSEGSNIVWKKDDNGKEDIVYFPYDTNDQMIIFTNQRVSKIKLKGLSNQFKEGLMYTVNQITDEDSYKDLVRVFRKVERGV